MPMPDPVAPMPPTTEAEKHALVGKLVRADYCGMGCCGERIGIVESYINEGEFFLKPKNELYTEEYPWDYILEVHQ